MSVVIKNMDMPDICEHCRFYNTYYDYPTCDITGYSEGYKFNGSKNRMLDCPLSELPTEVRIDNTDLGNPMLTAGYIQG